MTPFDAMMQRTASPSPDAKPARQVRGFTLFEMLVAISVFMVVSALTCRPRG